MKRSFFLSCALAICSQLTISASNVSYAAPPPNADPAFAPFYHSLTLPGFSAGYCCTESDCRPVESKFLHGTWFAMASKEIFGPDAPDKYVAVDPSHIIDEKDIPANKRPYTAVGCWYGNEWRCFIRPPQVY